MRKSLLLWSSFCLLLSSCDKKRVFDQYESLSGEWHKDSVVSFRLNAPDTTNTYNLFLNLRNNAQYPYNNIFLITELQFPHGKVISDTLEYEMARPSGEWLGTGFGEVKESKLWYKDHIKFPEAGIYRFSVQQAVRAMGEVEGLESLEGITDVGFRIETTEN